jgi:hypothetical protein
MRITGNGTVAIGTSTPSTAYKLYIKGDNYDGINSDTTNGLGIIGHSQTGQGIQGISSGAGYGVEGESMTGVGVRGISGSNVGVYGSSGGTYAGYFKWQRLHQRHDRFWFRCAPKAERGEPGIRFA